MELTPMQYKGYVWPHNPRTYTIRYQRKVAVHKIPFGRYAMQDLGLTRRVMTGEGEFYGPGAYDEFKKLASVFYQSGPGALVHPVWQSAKAYFVELALAQEPRKDYVKYTFTFWEDFEGYRQSLTAQTAPKPAAGTGTTAPPAVSAGRYHTVAAGETLWAIAQTYGLTLGGLMALNPQIKNPNVIRPGQQVRVG